MIDKFIAPVTSLLDKFIPDADTKQKIAHEIATMSERARAGNLHLLKLQSTEKKQRGTGSKQDGDQLPAGFAFWGSW